MNKLHVSEALPAPEQLLTLTESYIDHCVENHRMPNLAGLCRYLGISMEAFERLPDSHREYVARIRDALEDEALNSDMSPSLLSGYLKKRLGYGDEESRGDGDAVVVVFEHDALRDGE